jgi:hypothetical protein
MTQSSHVNAPAADPAEPLFRVEKNIPVPKQIRGVHYPFNIMSKGDSIMIPVPADEPDPANRAERIRANFLSSAKNFLKSRKLSWKFATRRVEEGVRCWRIE